MCRVQQSREDSRAPSFDSDFVFKMKKEHVPSRKLSAAALLRYAPPGDRGHRDARESPHRGREVGGRGPARVPVRAREQERCGAQQGRAKAFRPGQNVSAAFQSASSPSSRGQPAALEALLPR